MTQTSIWEKWRAVLLGATAMQQDESKQQRWQQLTELFAFDQQARHLLRDPECWGLLLFCSGPEVRSGRRLFASRAESYPRLVQAVERAWRSFPRHTVVQLLLDAHEKSPLAQRDCFDFFPCWGPRLPADCPWSSLLPHGDRTTSAGCIVARLFERLPAEGRLEFAPLLRSLVSFTEEVVLLRVRSARRGQQLRWLVCYLRRGNRMSQDGHHCEGAVDEECRLGPLFHILIGGSPFEHSLTTIDVNVPRTVELLYHVHNGLGMLGDLMLLDDGYRMLSWLAIRQQRRAPSQRAEEWTSTTDLFSYGAVVPHSRQWSAERSSRYRVFSSGPSGLQLFVAWDPFTEEERLLVARFCGLLASFDVLVAAALWALPSSGRTLPLWLASFIDHLCL